MRIPGTDGRTYDVDHAGEGDDYEVKLDGRVVGGFRLESSKTPSWVAEGASGQLTKKVIESLANEFVDRGGAVMHMA
jgi:hypothetical protein